MCAMSRTGEPSLATSVLSVLLITGGAMTALASLFSGDEGGIWFGLALLGAGLFLLDQSHR